MSIAQLEAIRGDLKKCVRCSLCKLVPMPTIQQTGFTSACPAVDEYHFHAYSGGGLQVMALALLDGRISVDGELAQIVSACTLCGHCDVSCKFIMAAERLDAILALKEHIAEVGFGVSPKKKIKPTSKPWQDGLELKVHPQPDEDVLLLAGAGANQNPEHAASARKLARLLEHAGVSFGILEGIEPDIGIEAYWTGQKRMFLKQAQEAVGILNTSRAETIVTLCGEDLGMLRSKYPRYALAPQASVLHASEFILWLIKKGRLKLNRPVSKQVTYHDPCYLGRQSEPLQDWQGEERQTHGVMRYFVPPKPINYGVNGVFDAPRQILRKIPGLKFVEMHRIREYAYCCGGGGGVPDSHPNVAQSAAIQRLNEAHDVGAELLVTTCQHCRNNLSCWKNETSPRVVDLVDLVFQAVEMD